MKKQLLFTLLFCFPLLIYAQGEYDFEDSTLHDWTNTDGTTTMLTYETHPSNADSNFGDNYMLKTCDGTNTAVGEMAFKLNYVTGGFLYGEHWGMSFDLYVKNDNNFPLYLRIGITGNNNAKVVTTNPVIVPALSDWTFISIGTQSNMTGAGYGNLHIIDYGDYVPNGSVNENFIFETLTDVAEFRIIHNSATSFDGEIVTGSLQIDNLFVFVPLSVEEKFLNAIKVYPNPVVDELYINFPHTTKGTLTLTSIDGRQLLSQELTGAQMQLDLSSIQSKGVYFLRIETSSGTLTKKIIKS